jgi:CoA:oxalate CoA-transferase
MEANMFEERPGPLADLTVVDFSWVLAGPYATRTLSDMGASVIKIEKYPTGASERWLPMRVTNRGVTQSSYSINVNRGKKSVCVNLKDSRGLGVVRDLIKKCDIVIENFAPGVMDLLGVDYGSCKKLRRDIIYCSISCFGHWGPYSHKPGYDVISQAASGWTAESDPEIIAPVSIGDLIAGMHAVSAILAALHHRAKTGKGQNIDISMMDCLFSLHENTLPWYMISEALGNAVNPVKIGAQHPGYAPYGIYRGKNGCIAIACLTEARWGPLLDAMGPDYEWLRADPRAKDVPTRCCTDNAQMIHEALGEWVMSLPSVEEAERVLDKAGVPSLRVRGLVELATEDEQIKAREMVLRIHQPFIGAMMMYGSPLKMSDSPCGIRSYAPLLGEHNREVLKQVLGHSDEYIDTLYTDGVLCHEDAVDRLKDEFRQGGSRSHSTHNSAPDA